MSLAIDKSISNDTKQHATDIKSKKSTLSRLASIPKKIGEKAINTLTFGHLCSPKLSQRKTSLIQNFKSQKLNEFPPLPSNVKVIPTSIQESRQFDSSIEGMRHFSREMVSLMIDRIQAMHIDPQLYDLRKVASDIPEILKNFANGIIELGTVSAKPIFEIFSKFNIDTKAQTHLNKALEWALKDIRPEDQTEDQFKQNFQNNLLERMLKADESRHSQNDQNITIKRKQCAEKVLEWLFKPDHSIAPKDIFQNEVDKPSDEMLMEVFQTTLQMLAEAKIEIYKNKANQIIGNDFEETFKNTLKENALIITDTLTAQVGNILDMGSEQFTVLCDKIIEVVGVHFSNVMESHEEASAALSDHLLLKKHAEEIYNNPSADAEIRKKCRTYLENLRDKKNINQLKEDLLLKAFLAKTGNLLPSLQNKTIDTISDLILKTLLPDASKNGKLVSGLENLLSKIKIPPEFKMLLDEAVEIVENITTQETSQELVQLSKIAKDATKEFGLSCVSVAVKLGLSESIELVTKHMSKPEELNLMMANSILPTAREMMVQFFADDIISANIKKLAPLFHKLPDAESETNIINELLLIAKKESQQYTFDSVERKAEFQNAVHGRIKEIEELLGKIRKKSHLKSFQETELVLREYYSSNERSLDLIEQHAENFKSLFHQLPDAKTENILLNKLLEIAKKNFPKRSLDTPEKVQLFLKSFRLKIGRIAQSIEEEKNRKQGKYHLKNTESILKNYIKNTKKTKDNNPYFGFFLDAGLSSGEFGKLLPSLFNMQTVRNSVTQLITDSIKSLRTSLQVCLNKSIPAIRDKYKNEKTIDEWITSSPEIDSLNADIHELKLEIRQKANDDKASKQLTEKLDEKIKIRDRVIAQQKRHTKELINAKNKTHNEVEKVAQLGYDMILFKTGQKVPVIGKFILKRFLGPNADKIKRTVLKIFNSIFGRHVFNEHLMSKILLTASKGLNILSTGSSNSLPLTQLKNQEILSELAAPVSAPSVNDVPFEIELDSLITKVSVWKRVQEWAVRQFKKLGKLFKKFWKFLKPKAKTLSSRQIMLMNSLEKKEVIPQPVIPPSPYKKKSSPREFAVKASPIDAKKIPELFKKNLDLNDSLKELQKFVSDLVGQMEDGVYTFKIKPIKKFIKLHGTQLPEYVKQFLDFASKISEPAALSIMKRLQKSYKSELDETTRNFLSTLFTELRNKDNNNIREEDTKALVVVLMKLKEKLPSLTDQELNHYIKPVIQWISQNYEHPSDIRSLEYYVECYRTQNANLNYDDQIVSMFYVAAIQWAVRHKIENHLQGFQNFLQNNLAKLIKVHLHKNMQHLSQLLSNRIFGLLNLIPADRYKKFVDGIASYFNEQIVNLKSANDAVKNDKSKLVKEFENTANYNLHPMVKRMFEPNANRAAIENEIFVDLVERLIDLILPTRQQNVNGQMVDVDAFQELWDSIIIEPEVLAEIEKIKDFIKSILPSKIAGKFDEIEDFSLKQVKKFSINLIKHYATKSLADTLRTSFKMVSDTNKRNELLADNFPVVHKLLFNKFASLVGKKTANQEELFRMIIESRVTPETRAKLVDTLFNLCKKEFKHSWEKLNVTPEEFEKNYLDDIIKSLTNEYLKDFILNNNFAKTYPDLIKLSINPSNSAALESIAAVLIESVATSKKWQSDRKIDQAFVQIIKPLFVSIARELKEAQKMKMKKSRGAELDNEAIKNELLKFFNGEKEDKNTPYLDIILNAIKMGNMSGGVKGLIEFLTGSETLRSIFDVRKFLNDNILIPSLQPIRSLRSTLDMAIDGLRNKFLNKKYIETLINPETLSILQERSKAIDNRITEKQKLKEKTTPDNHKIHDDKIIELEKEKAEVLAKIALKEEEVRKEPQRLLDMQARFNSGLELTSLLAYDILDYTTKQIPFGNYGFKKAMSSTKDLEDTIKHFYTTFFEVDILNEALPVKILQDALQMLEDVEESAATF